MPYEAFTVSRSNIPQVIRYIKDQREHHRQQSVQEEYREFLWTHGIEYDKRYLGTDSVVATRRVLVLRLSPALKRRAKLRPTLRVGFNFRDRMPGFSIVDLWEAADYFFIQSKGLGAQVDPFAQERLMIKWCIDKESRVPLYLQLKDLVRYYISTGAILSNQRLPTVKELSKKLEINFETIRKAYKQLEKEGLITTKRGSGTFASNHLGLKTQTDLPAGLGSRPLDSVKDLLKKLILRGIPTEEVRIMVEQALSEVSAEGSGQLVVFTECNVSQIREISTLLRDYLSVNVEPVLIKDLREKVENISSTNGELLAVLTTGFHMKEVRNALQGLPVKIDFLVTNMSLATRRELDALEKTARIGFVCRDRESIPFYREMLREELGLDSDIDCCTLAEEAKVKALFGSVDVVLVSPPVYEEVKKLAPRNLRVFNVFNRVDPMSLKIIKDRLLEGV